LNGKEKQNDHGEGTTHSQTDKIQVCAANAGKKKALKQTRL